MSAKNQQKQVTEAVMSGLLGQLGSAGAALEKQRQQLPWYGYLNFQESGSFDLQQTLRRAFFAQAMTTRKTFFNHCVDVTNEQFYKFVVDTKAVLVYSYCFPEKEERSMMYMIGDSTAIIFQECDGERQHMQLFTTDGRMLDTIKNKKFGAIQ